MGDKEPPTQVTAQNTRLRLDRVTAACRNCRLRKVRCSGGRPCKDCLRLQKECIYLPLQRRKRKRKGEESPAQGSGVAGGDRFPEAGSSTESTHHFPASPLEATTRALPSIDNALSERHSQPAPPECTAEDSKWEYHEPWSWLSLCSEMGCKWTWSVTGSREFVAIAKRFACEVMRNVAPSRDLLTTMNATEPSELDAWEYVDAFYENCWEADVGIIEHHQFKTLLQSHYNERSRKEDPAWLALRNVVFAAGYRSILAKTPNVSFVSAQHQAQPYFNNALSVLLRLLMPPSSLTAVRALLLMTCYAEGLGNPAFKHFLCSNAVHLALTKGLHRQPDSAWGISDDECLQRNWLWWTTYALEKLLAFCGSRPSAIDDTNVSTDIPTAVPGQSNIHMETSSIGAHCAKIQSEILRQLLSFQALSLSLTEVIRMVDDFDQQLNQLLEKIPQDFKVGTLARPSSSSRRLVHILYVHFSVYGSLMAAHSHFFYPWLTSRFVPDNYNHRLESQIAHSSSTVAEAARKILLALRLVNTNVTTPSWLAFHYPICAFINLFIYVLKYPTLSTATADLGLLDLCTGHFGYIEFLTSSQVSISLPREAANFASKFVKAAKAKALETVSDLPTNASEHFEGTTHIPGPETSAAGIENFDSDTNLPFNLNDFIDMKSAGWNLLSSFDMITSTYHNSSEPML